MKGEAILKSDLLDLLFDQKNKAYGAYQLRKGYRSRLLQSIGIMTGTVIILSAFTFLPTAKPAAPFRVTEQIFAHVIVPAIPAKVVPPSPAKANPKPVSTAKLLSTIEIVKDPVTADVLTDITHSAIGSINNLVENDPGVTFVSSAGPGGITSEGQAIADLPVKEDPNEIVANPEVAPAFPGGMAAFRRYLLKNLREPRSLEEGEMITVKVKFVVGFDGKLQDFELVQDGGAAFNAEVMRVLKKMPDWIPGKSSGKNVAVYHIIPVKFIAEQ